MQEQCVQRIEAVQKEKDEAVKRFEEEKKKMEEEAASLQAGFSRQREKMEEENGHEMQHLIAQFEQQRTELENTEIIGLVRSIHATPEELAELLRSMKSKGVSSYD